MRHAFVVPVFKLSLFLTVPLATSTEPFSLSHIDGPEGGAI